MLPCRVDAALTQGMPCVTGVWKHSIQVVEETLSELAAERPSTTLEIPPSVQSCWEASQLAVCCSVGEDVGGKDRVTRA